MQQTISYKGKIYALECGCKERGGYDYSIRTDEHPSRVHRYYPWTEPETNHIFPDTCEHCGYYPWIILK